MSILSLEDAHRAVQLTARLVSIPSVNPMGRELYGPKYSVKAVAVFIKSFLSNIGVECNEFGEDPANPNIIATINKGYPETILLQAHMDTVSDEQMSISPFEVSISEGRLYGRGSCDTKASIAVYLSAIEKIVKENLSLKRNLVLAFVKDEEYSFSGAKELMNQPVQAEFAIVGEPTGLDIIYAHKGLVRFFIRTDGHSCHASTPWLGKNAIGSMGPVLMAIEKYAESLKDLTHPVLGQATINVGRISGGQTVNTVPSSCHIEIDHRLLPGMSFQSVCQALSPFLSGLDYRIEEPYLLAAGIENPEDAFYCLELQQACIQNGVHAAFRTAHFATDASIIHNAGIPCMVFGPGSIVQAHTKDEYVSIDSVIKAEEIILSLLTH